MTHCAEAAPRAGISKFGRGYGHYPRKPPAEAQRHERRPRVRVVARLRRIRREMQPDITATQLGTRLGSALGASDARGSQKLVRDGTGSVLRRQIDPAGQGLVGIARFPSNGLMSL